MYKGGGGGGAAISPRYSSAIHFSASGKEGTNALFPSAIKNNTFFNFSLFFYHCRGQQGFSCAINKYFSTCLATFH